MQVVCTGAQEVAVVCCACAKVWKEGCGCDGAFAGCADGLQRVQPCLQAFSSAIWCLGSPVAFPFVFCFSPEPHTNESSGWAISMLQAPCAEPCACCLTTVCLPCGQWELRRRALDGDWSRYKLWQGYHDGPHCCAAFFKGAPVVIEAGTHGEQSCPHAFLCAEVWCLGGPCSSCCAFDATRRLMQDHFALGTDPTEARQHKCAACFGNAAHQCSKAACCLCLAGCLAGCCAPESGGAQEFAADARHGAGACWRVAYTLHRGIWSVKLLAIGCMSAQMLHEQGLRARAERDGGARGAEEAGPAPMAMARE